MRNFILSAAVGAMLVCIAGTVANAAILSQSETFSDGGVGTLPANSTLLVTQGYTWSPGGDDNNPGGWGNNQNGSGGADGGQNQDDRDAGDGANDGGIFVDGDLAGETVSYDFTGAIAAGETYTFETNLYQSSSSFTRADVELLVDGTVVSSELNVGGINGHLGNVADAGKLAPYVLLSDYTATSADAGKTLSFLVRNLAGIGPSANGSRDVGIDNWALTVTAIPEPGTLALAALGLCGLGVRRRR